MDPVCFVDLVKALGRVLWKSLWQSLLEYGAPEPLL